MAKNERGDLSPSKQTSGTRSNTSRGALDGLGDLSPSKQIEAAKNK